MRWVMSIGPSALAANPQRRPHVSIFLFVFDSACNKNASSMSNGATNDLGSFISVSSRPEPKNRTRKRKANYNCARMC